MATSPNLAITLLETTTGNPEATINGAINILDENAAQGARIFSKRSAATSGLVWAFYGGTLVVDGLAVSVTSATVTLSASTTNYVSATRAGVVSTQTGSMPADRIPIREIVTGASSITSEIDRREWLTAPVPSLLAKSITSDANYTLTALESTAQIMQFTSSVSLTAQRDVILPLVRGRRVIYNNTTGGRNIRVIGASGNGVIVPVNQRIAVYCNGADWVAEDAQSTMQEIAYAASITPSHPTGATVIVGALTGNLTVNAPTSPIKGGRLTFILVQDATGGRTITWNAVFKKAADGAGAANQKGATSFYYDGTDWIQEGGPLTFF